MDAAPGAVIYRGLREGVSVAEVRAAAGTRRMVELLRAYPARPRGFPPPAGGDCARFGSGGDGGRTANPGRRHTAPLRLDRRIRPPPPSPAHRTALLALEIDPPGGVFLEPMEGAGERLLADCPDYRVWERRRGMNLSLGEEGELRILAVVRAGRA